MIIHSVGVRTDRERKLFVRFHTDPDDMSSWQKHPTIVELDSAFRERYAHSWSVAEDSQPFELIELLKTFFSPFEWLKLLSKVRKVQKSSEIHGVSKKWLRDAVLILKVLLGEPMAGWDLRHLELMCRVLDRDVLEMIHLAMSGHGIPTDGPVASMDIWRNYVESRPETTEAIRRNQEQALKRLHKPKRKPTSKRSGQMPTKKQGGIPPELLEEESLRALAAFVRRAQTISTLKPFEDREGYLDFGSKRDVLAWMSKHQGAPFTRDDSRNKKLSSAIFSWLRGRQYISFKDGRGPWIRVGLREDLVNGSTPVPGSVPEEAPDDTQVSDEVVSSVLGLCVLFAREVESLKVENRNDGFFVEIGSLEEFLDYADSSGITREEIVLALGVLRERDDILFAEGTEDSPLFLALRHLPEDLMNTDPVEGEVETEGGSDPQPDNQPGLEDEPVAEGEVEPDPESDGEGEDERVSEGADVPQGGSVSDEGSEHEGEPETPEDTLPEPSGDGITGDVTPEAEVHEAVEPASTATISSLSDAVDFLSGMNGDVDGQLKAATSDIDREIQETEDRISALEGKLDGLQKKRRLVELISEELV